VRHAGTGSSLARLTPPAAPVEVQGRRTPAFDGGMEPYDLFHMLLIRGSGPARPWVRRCAARLQLETDTLFIRSVFGACPMPSFAVLP
jgi:hypothetical protein